MTSREIGAAKFKEQCLALLDELGPEGIVVTKHGKPVARVLPIGRDFSQFIGSMSDRLEITGDVLSTGVRWDAEP